jgi:N6-adenosine-specific RNA methylase IME4
MMTKYEIIYADPPWDYGGQKMLSGSKAENHYPTMKLSELKALPVQSITDDNALLFMWSSSPHLDQAIELMKAWGFSYATVAFVWDKVRPVSGFYTMSQCEICLVGKKGKIPQPRGVRNALQFLSEKKGRHSAKPAEVRTRIENMFPHQKKLEMFARETVVGWDAFGNEISGGIRL